VFEKGDAQCDEISPFLSRPQTAKISKRGFGKNLDKAVVK